MTLTDLLNRLISPPRPQQYVVLVRGMWGRKVLGVYADQYEALEVAGRVRGDVHRVQREGAN